MNAANRSRILEAHRLRGESLEPPATEAQLLAFEKLIAAIPADVRWYLATCGGGRVGDERLDGYHALAMSHRRLAAGPWSIKSRDVFLVGWDATGGPIAVERQTGRVLAEDGFFGGIVVLAPSFEAFLLDGLVNGSRRWVSHPASRSASSIRRAP